jgi:hypothetical protein
MGSGGTSKQGVSSVSSIFGPRRVLSTCVIAAALAVGLCAQAGAFAFQPFYEFTISFVGKGSYTRSVTEESGPSDLEEEASWKWDTVIPHVLIPTKASSPLLSAGFPAIGLGQDGSGSWKIVLTGDESEDCSHSGALGLETNALGGGGGSVKVHRPGHGSGVIFDLIAVNGFKTTSGGGDGVSACEPENWWQSTIRGFAGVGSNHTGSSLPDVQPLTAKLTVSPSELKHGSFTRSVSIGPSEEVPSDCGSGDGSFCKQSYTWSGTVKFTKHKFKI